MVARQLKIKLSNYCLKECRWVYNEGTGGVCSNQNLRLGNDSTGLHFFGK